MGKAGAVYLEEEPEVFTLDKRIWKVLCMFASARPTSTCMLLQFAATLPILKTLARWAASKRQFPVRLKP